MKTLIRLEENVMKITVFCGSNTGASEVYVTQVKEFGRELVKRDITLVFGGGRVGLMGTLADAVLEAGGHVIGVMPQFLDDKEIAHDGLSELIIVNTMHERKAKMAELADAFITLPGGPGTLEEFFEIFTWTQLGIHKKPSGILNINQYFDPIVELFDHMTDEEFLEEKFRNMIAIDVNPSNLIDKLKDCEIPAIKTYLTEPN